MAGMARGTAERGPQRIDGILSEVLARLGANRDLAECRLWEVWDDVVGPGVARNAQPLRFASQRLVVTVKSTGWMQELTMLREELTARLNERVGQRLVNEIFFVLGRIEEKTRSPSVAGQQPRARAMRPRQDVDARSTAADPAEAERRLRHAIDRLWRAASEPPRSDRSS
jgi:predicted nucleic acid-binding Zn ribbon protein